MTNTKSEGRSVSGIGSYYGDNYLFDELRSIIINLTTVLCGFIGTHEFYIGNIGLIENELAKK